MRVIAVLLVIACANGEDTCFHKATNTQGICILLINCTYAYKGVLNQVDPQVCSLAQTAPIVCCPIDTIPSLSTTTTTPIPTAAIPISTITTRPIPTTLSSKKCLEYSKSVKRDRCRIKDGTSSLEPSKASLGDFPHLAAILFNPKYSGNRPTYKCFGSLISESFVLMPQHCYLFRGEQPIEVHLGLVTLTHTDWLTVQKLKVKEIKPHPESKDDFYNDLALIKLDGQVKFNQYVHPICLGDEEGWKNSNPLMAGWTMMNESAPNALMEQVGVDVVSSANCETAYEPFRNKDLDYMKDGVPDDQLICASPKGSDVVFASGSSLMIRSKEVDCMHTLVGSLTFTSVYTRNLPTIITRMQSHRKWIESVVWS